MTSLKPFFSYYGSKWRTANYYPAPRFPIVIEPFAGSAGYALRHSEKDVRLYDRDERVISTWQYLIKASADEIRRLPLLHAKSHIDDFDLVAEQKYLIGWWLNKGSAAPCKSPSSWMRQGIRPDSFWGEVIRERIASQVDSIRHWKAEVKSYDEIDIDEASWFVDPPYADKGKYYRYSSKSIDYDLLGEWCRSRSGQVIVCENQGADWLPFKPFRDTKAMHGGSRSGVSKEAVWLND